MAGRGKRKQTSEVKELLLLLALKKAGPIGRYRLKSLLNFTEREGVVRRMLNDLEREGLVSASKTGSKLTSDGELHLKKKLDAYNIVVVEQFDFRELGFNNSYCIHIHGSANNIETVVKHRDDAVRAGALGATIIIYKNGVLKVPKVYPNLSDEYPKIVEGLHHRFNMLDNDVLVVGFAEDKWRALEGAIAAVMKISG